MKPAGGRGRAPVPVAAGSGKLAVVSTHICKSEKGISVMTPRTTTTTDTGA